MTGNAETIEVKVTDETQVIFNRQLATYRKVTRENLMHHREVYGILRDILASRKPVPFRFLDIACGDASASVAALQGTPIACYYGIDLSARSLALAKETLRALPCPVELECCDFAQALGSWTAPVDVAWLGMSLHHLNTVHKQRFMSDVCSALHGSGLFLIWEPTYLGDEDRQGWLDRFAALRPQWAALTDDEFVEMQEHMLAADFPETADDWMEMGRRAGFGQVSEVFITPNRMSRVFRFSA